MFFDGERPRVEERLGVVGEREVAAEGELVVIGPCGEGCGEGGAGGGEVPVVVEEEGDSEGGDGHGEEGREDAGETALPEVGEGESAEVFGAEEDAGDEVAGEGEEDIDAGEAAGEPEAVEVEDEDGEDGDGAEAVDFRPVGGMGLGLHGGAPWVGCGRGARELVRGGRVRRRWI